MVLIIFCYYFFFQSPEHVYCTETRPYNQGARLTAYELVHEKLPATLVLDSMVAALLRTRNIAAVVVGADRVCTFTSFAGNFTITLAHASILYRKFNLAQD